MLDAAEFKEGDHPRGQPKNAGQFASKPGGKGAGSEGGGEASPTEGEGKSKTKSKYTGKVAPRHKQVEGTVALNGYLRKLADIQKMPEGLKSPAEFLLENGQNYVVNDKTYEGKRDPMHECYKNATLAALGNEDRTYVEGYMNVHGVPIEHAWTVDKTGQVYDSTITPNMGVEGYYGVPFKTDYVLASGLMNKVYGLLGMESKKTIKTLLGGKQKDFKQKVDVDSLSPVVIADRLAYADAAAKSIPPTDKIDTPERQELRKQVTDKLYNKDIEKRKRNREATIILGLPGMGKSTFAAPLLKDGALEIDPDLAKAELPEFHGGVGANATHEESSAITRNLLQQAVTNGDNFVWPRIDSPDKLKKDLQSLKDAGYKVNVTFVDGDYQHAIKNALHRFLTKGRYVSLETLQSYGDSPRKAYEDAVKSGLVKKGEVYKSLPGNKFEKSE